MAAPLTRHDGPRAAGVADARFRRGWFLGHADRRAHIDGVALADMRPTVPAREVAAHGHEDAHFVVVHRGVYASSARGMPAACSGPAIVFNPPGTQHRDHFATLDGARFLTVSLEAARWHAVAGADASDAAVRLPSSALPAAYRMWRELLRSDDATALVVEAELLELLSRAHARERRATSPATCAPAWLVRARARIEDAPAQVPSVAELAREADLHPVYLARAFRRAYGASPGEFLRRHRVDAAIAGACAGREPLAELAQRCGYVDQSHMHHAVRAATGLTPAALRRLGRLEVADLQERRRRVVHAAVPT